MLSVPTPEPPSRGSLVLVVEDELLTALDLKLLLERHGYRVLGPAATVAETPDAALLDLNLRGERVTPVTEALRGSGVPFLLASAYDGPELVAAGLAEAPNAGKPTSERRLFAALAQAVGQQSGR